MAIEESQKLDRARRLRMGMVGGGAGAFIGAVHRMAMRLDDRYEFVAGALSSDGERAHQSGVALGLAPARSYHSLSEMIAGERGRSDGIEVAVVVTPNHHHFEACKTLLEAGIDVICDKPMTTTLPQALELVRLVKQTGRSFVLTQNNTAYPMIRQARAMVQRGELGAIRVVQVCYAQDWLTGLLEASGQKQAAWRTDPAQAGVGGSIGDIGVHAFNLAAFITGLELDSVCADIQTFVEGRKLDDNAHVLLRYQGGARGMLWSSQVAPGNNNRLQIGVYGDKGGLEWMGEAPDNLRFTPVGAEPRTIVRGGAGANDFAAHGTRMPSGHPEGYIEGFGVLYRDAADLILAAREGRSGPEMTALLPTVLDGAKGVGFIDAVVASSRAGGTWVDARLPL